MKALRIVSFSLLLILSSCLANAQSHNTAVIVMDVQDEFTKNVLDSLDSEALIENINTVIKNYRTGSEIIFVKAHIRMLEISFKGIKTVSSPYLDLDSRLDRQQEDPVFMKQEASAFTLPEFNKYMEEHQVDQLVMCGLFLGECLSATTKQALEKDYEVSIVKEASAAKKAKKKEKLLSELAEAGATIVLSDN